MEVILDCHFHLFVFFFPCGRCQDTETLQSISRTESVHEKEGTDSSLRYASNFQCTTGILVMSCTSNFTLQLSKKKCNTSRVIFWHFIWRMKITFSKLLKDQKLKSLSKILYLSRILVDLKIFKSHRWKIGTKTEGSYSVEYS